MPPGAPPPIGLIQRFGLLIEALKRAVADGAGRDRARLGPLSVLLWGYLARTMGRLAALHARFEAGTLCARRVAPPRPASERPRPERRRIPRGPVLLPYWVAHLHCPLRQLVEEPEMRALLAAAPQAGRLLRPLWRMLTTDELPEALRLPPRPRPPPRPRQLWRFRPLEPDATQAAARPPHPPPPQTMAPIAPAEPWVPDFRLPQFSAA